MANAPNCSPIWDWTRPASREAVVKRLPNNGNTSGANHVVGSEKNAGRSIMETTPAAGDAVG
jgi:hypothetical protein